MRCGSVRGGGPGRAVNIKVGAEGAGAAPGESGVEGVKARGRLGFGMGEQLGTWMGVVHQ